MSFSIIKGTIRPEDVILDVGLAATQKADIDAKLSAAKKESADNVVKSRGRKFIEPALIMVGMLSVVGILAVAFAAPQNIAVRCWLLGGFIVLAFVVSFILSNIETENKKVAAEPDDKYPVNVRYAITTENCTVQNARFWADIETKQVEVNHVALTTGDDVIIWRATYPFAIKRNIDSPVLDLQEGILYIPYSQLSN